MKISKVQDVYLVEFQDRQAFDWQASELAKYVNRSKGDQRRLEKCYTFAVSDGSMSVFTYNLSNSYRTNITAGYPYAVDISDGINLKFSVHYKDFERILKRLRGAFSIVITSRGLFFEDGKEYFYCEDLSGYHSDKFETIYDQNKTGYAVNVERFKTAIRVNAHLLMTYRGKKVEENYNQLYTFINCSDSMRVIEDINTVENLANIRCYKTENLLQALDQFGGAVVVYPINEDSIRHIMQIDDINKDYRVSFLLAGCSFAIEDNYIPVTKTCNVEYERVHNDNG